MNATAFDAIARKSATGCTRRGLLGLVGGAVLNALGAPVVGRANEPDNGGNGDKDKDKHNGKGKDKHKHKDKKCKRDYNYCATRAIQICGPLITVGLLEYEACLRAFEPCCNLYRECKEDEANACIVGLLRPSA